MGCEAIHIAAHRGASAQQTIGWSSAQTNIESPTMARVSTSTKALQENNCARRQGSRLSREGKG